MIAVIDLGEEHISHLAAALKILTGDFRITTNEIEICKADKVIIAGYGEASYGIKQLHLLNLFSVIRIIKKPMLGIGLGMHLMAHYSAEGNVSCLGFFPGSTEKFNGSFSEPRHRTMDMIEIVADSKLLSSVKASDSFFFDHGYYLPVNGYTSSESVNGTKFSASAEKGNSYAVQFHPEKSGEPGLIILQNFIDL